MPTTSAFEQLPVVVEHRLTSGGAAVKFLHAGLAAGALSPVIAIGAHAFAEPQALLLAASRPWASIQVVAGLGIWSAMMLLPLTRALRVIAGRRKIVVDAASVTVDERSLLGGRTWTEPLRNYRGIAHHIRASMSGTRHELILVHADATKNLVVATADRIGQEELDRAKVLLGLAELPARVLYSRQSRKDERLGEMAIGIAPAHG